MDEATVAGNLNQALREASDSVHFREHFNEVGDTWVIEYHFTVLPEKIDLHQLLKAFSRATALYWTQPHEHPALNLDGFMGKQKVSMVISLRKESE